MPSIRRRFYGRKSRTSKKRSASSKSYKSKNNSKSSWSTSRRKTTAKNSVGRKRAKKVSRKSYPRKLKKLVKDPFENGFRQTYEIHADFNGASANSLTIGHSTACPQRNIIGVLATVVQELFAQSGQSIENWSIGPELPTVDYKIEFFVYKNLFVEDISYITTGSLVGLNYYQIVLLCYAAMNDFFDANELDSVPIFDTVRLHKTTGAGDCLGKVSFKDFKVDMENISTLTFQNSTNAENAAPNDDLADDVCRNPLIGKHYYGSNCNGFYPTERVPGEAYVSLISDNQNGLIKTDSSSSLEEWTLEPPEGRYFYRTSKETTIYMKPGAIRVSKLVWKKSYTFDDFIKSHYRFLRDTYNGRADIGNSEMFILEKQLFDGSETSNIRLPYQIELMHKYKARYKPKGKIPVLKTV